MPLLFGDFLLDSDRRELMQASRPVSVGPQVFDLLLYLIQNRERVISKDDLLEAVWRGRIVSESTITTLINAARVAIGDNGQDQRFIRTVPRKGFRFVGEVRYVLEGSLRKAGNRVRIAGQLVDAATGDHLWADRYEGALDNILDLQDQITEGVVSAIARQVENAEIARAARKPPCSRKCASHARRSTTSCNATPCAPHSSAASWRTLVKTPSKRHS